MCRGREGARDARGHRACPCRDAWRAARGRPWLESSGAEDRGLRASLSNPARSSFAVPIVETRSSHRHVHVDHTELLTVASAGMGSDGRLKVDAAVASGLTDVAQTASKLERRGYDCCWTAEINHDPFLPLVLAAEHTTRIELGTSI